MKTSDPSTAKIEEETGPRIQKAVGAVSVSFSYLQYIYFGRNPSSAPGGRKMTLCRPREHVGAHRSAMCSSGLLSAYVRVPEEDP